MTEGRSREATEYAAVSDSQQEVIDGVLDRYGGQALPDVSSALREGLAAAGLARPTEPWLDAVAAEIANGHRFVVRPRLESGDESGSALLARAAADDAVSDRSVPATHPRELWFSHDPKIDHVPPDDAVEHPAVQEEE
jgi:hypothetical protein